MKNTITIILLALLLLSNIHIMADNRIGEYKTRGIYITYTKGICLDNDGNGQDLYADEPYNYIAYDSSKVEVGQTVTSIFVYNPFTIWGDDIIARFDF